MTPIGGEAHAELTRLVVVDPATAHPVDTPPAVHRMRAASLDNAWHALLADVYDHCLEPVPS